MRRYIPRIHLIESTDGSNFDFNMKKEFCFPETEFMAVSAYRNKQVNHTFHWKAADHARVACNFGERWLNGRNTHAGAKLDVHARCEGSRGCLLCWISQNQQNVDVFKVTNVQKYILVQRAENTVKTQKLKTYEQKILICRFMMDITKKDGVEYEPTTPASF